MRKIEQSKKFRGVRQRHWGSWVSEIRHPLLKKRVWLGTFESAEAAARAYDEAAILMNGRNAKTNFPSSTRAAAEGAARGPHFGSPSAPSATQKGNLSEILHAKLRRGSKTPSSRSVTCLRLDTESCNIGVWQKRVGGGGGGCGQSSAAAENDSNWVLTVELRKVENSNGNGGALGQTSSPSSEPNRASEGELSTKSESAVENDDHEDDQDRLARQMIEELLLT